MSIGPVQRKSITAASHLIIFDDITPIFTPFSRHERFDDSSVPIHPRTRPTGSHAIRATRQIAQPSRRERQRPPSRRSGREGVKGGRGETLVERERGHAGGREGDTAEMLVSERLGRGWMMLKGGESVVEDGLSSEGCRSMWVRQASTEVRERIL